MKRLGNAKTIFTFAFLAGLLLLVALRNNGWRLPQEAWFPIANWTKSTPGPEDAIYAMLDAARAGDTKTYLDSFSGRMRAQLLQTVKETSERNFAEYLRTQNADFQGVAVSVTDRPSDSEAQVRVEYVYSGRNDVQSVYLRKDSSRWKIVKVASAARTKTLVPFGSAVTD